MEKKALKVNSLTASKDIKTNGLAIEENMAGYYYVVAFVKPEVNDNFVDYKLEEPILSNEDQSDIFFNYFDELGVHHYFYIVIEKIGYLCNLLKNRPWAQSNYLVSMIDFNERCEDLYKTFWDLISSLGFSNLSILEMFERKYEVNKWRMKTGY